MMNFQPLHVHVPLRTYTTCSCNFTSTNLEDSQLTCSDDGIGVILITTVAYSSDITASDMINALKSWAAINGDASLGIGGVTATVSQVCSPSCETPSPPHDSNSGVVAAGSFIGGLILGMILLAIPVIVVW